MKLQKDFLYQMNAAWHYTQFYTTLDKLEKRQTFFNLSMQVFLQSTVLSGFNSTTSWKLLKLCKIKRASPFNFLMFSGKNKYDRSGLQVAPRFSWTAKLKRGEIHGRSARDWGRDAQNFLTFYSCAYALVSQVYSTQCRKSVYEDQYTTFKKN